MAGLDDFNDYNYEYDEDMGESLQQEPIPPQPTTRTSFVHLVQKKLNPPNLAFQTQTKKTKQIDYDDILASMNLCVKNGKLHTRNKTGSESPEPSDQASSEQPIQTNLDPAVVLERRKQIYRRAVWLNYVQKEAQRKRVKEVKTKKLAFINTNIGFSEGDNSNVNKIFNFMNR